ncbi:DNA polymerase III subunit [Moraxella nasibovis]|uniref:DNA polymerase III subunit n=1 Tax=Moraxella nasibovis TaxID=2904120 RepID=UPI00240FC220|nr:DNA polymerase III subunit [Moraxella nasibovis]WFF39236.1 DNA polymerase III subunit [Moraxella nasibovis]
MSEQSQQLPYFAPLLPWQNKAWEQVTCQFFDGKLPHGILASGMAGIGKRAFVWRFVAWLLCHDKGEHGACGSCQSCGWLRAGTHPDLMVLPSIHLPTAEPTDKTSAPSSIKIDEVRALQEYSHIKGQGVRLMVLDGADTLTVGASNALLKTLEEPRAGVHLILISDNPTRLLPTIKSRVQTLPLHHIRHEAALSFVADKLGDESLAYLALDLADGAVLKAVDLPKEAWFDKRTLWLKTWLALRMGQRLPMAASDYWQGVLGFDEFVILTRLMLIDVVRVGLGLPSRHTDMDVENLIKNQALNLQAMENFLLYLDDVVLSVRQNVQEKLAYDGLFVALAKL